MKPLYGEVWESITELCQYLIDQLGVVDSSGDPLTPRQCQFRIYRDARRIKPGGPLYKHHLSFLISPYGKKTMGSGYYLHIEPANTFLACGINRATAAYIYPLRQKLMHHGDQYHALVNDQLFKKTFGSVTGQSLKRPPKGYGIDAPHLDLIMRKQHLVMRSYDDDLVLGDQWAQQILEDITIVQPRNDWLNDRE